EIATADAEVVVDAESAPANDARKQRVADALLAADPTLERFPKNEARSKREHIELNSTGDGRGIQIGLYDHEAAVTIPYGFRDDEVGERFERIWGYLKIMQRGGGYFVFDPQI